MDKSQFAGVASPKNEIIVCQPDETLQSIGMPGTFVESH